MQRIINCTFNACRWKLFSDENTRRKHATKKYVQNTDYKMIKNHWVLTTG